MSEWSKVRLSKSRVPNGTVGSTPTLSASEPIDIVSVGSFPLPKSPQKAVIFVQTIYRWVNSPPALLLSFYAVILPYAIVPTILFMSPSESTMMVCVLLDVA